MRSVLPKYHTKLRHVFNDIRKRCNNKNHKHYKSYGGRGIRCEWKNFDEFYRDIIDLYKEGLQIDRIDNNGNYCKENCRMVTNIQNQRNKRNNVIINGVCASEYFENLGIDYHTAMNRYKLNWDIERIKNTPVRKCVKK